LGGKKVENQNFNVFPLSLILELNFMASISTFESRTGKLDCRPEEIFEFVTDIRNLKTFVRGNTVSDLQIERDTCSFNVSPLGNISLGISEKVAVTKVVFTGSVFKSNDFSMLLDIREGNAGRAEVTVTLNAEMNPVLKMMAAKPVAQFLENLIDEMERFKDWNDVKA
jgi:hypothetical protein